MTRILHRAGVALAFLLLAMSPALAADNYRIIEATGATRTMAASDIGSVLYPRQLIQGLSGGVPTSVQMTTPGALNVNCVVGCSGGGGGVVTNAGTFAVQNTAAIPTGANTIGTVNLGTLNGAATAAKQPALGVAGTASLDVITVQGAATGTPLRVDCVTGCSGGGGGGAVTVADGADVAQGDKDDLAATSSIGSFNIVQLLKGILGASLDTSDVNTRLNNLGGFAINLGAGNAGTGTQRVILATDQPAFTVNVAQATAASLNATVVQTTASNFNAQVVGNVAHDAADAGNGVKISGVFKTTPLAVSASGDRTDILTDAYGRVGTFLCSNAAATTCATVAGVGAGVTYPGANHLIVGSIGLIWNGSSYEPITKSNTTARLLSSAATTNATSAKNSFGTVQRITAYNTNAAVRYLKLYNKASAPTVGTDVPIMTIPLPATSVFNMGFDSGGYYFPLGIAYAITTGVSDADTGAVGAGDILGLNIIFN